MHCMVDAGRNSSQRKGFWHQKRGGNFTGDAKDLVQAKNLDATVQFVLQLVEGISIRH